MRIHLCLNGMETSQNTRRHLMLVFFFGTRGKIKYMIQIKARQKIKKGSKILCKYNFSKMLRTRKTNKKHFNESVVRAFRNCLCRKCFGQNCVQFFFCRNKWQPKHPPHLYTQITKYMFGQRSQKRPTSIPL